MSSYSNAFNQGNVVALLSELENSETGLSYDKKGNLLGLTRTGHGSLSYDVYDGKR